MLARMRPIHTEEAQTDLGPLLIHSDDEVISPIIRAHGTWEPELGEKLRAVLRPGMTAVDVGGNIGYTALLMAEAVGPEGRVFAIEPDPRNAHVLRLNAERTRGAPVEVVEAAAWSEPGELELALSESNTGDHRVGLTGAGRETVSVRAVALDDVLPASVDLLLMDVQAAEHVALRGARELLRRSRPLVFVEFWPTGIREAGDDPLSVLEEYAESGFAITGAEEPLPSDLAELVAAVEGSEMTFTTLRLEPAAVVGG
jgi:FkbM family methyltransferase